MSLLDDLIENIRKANGNTDDEIEKELKDLPVGEGEYFENEAQKTVKITEAQNSALQNATGTAEAIETYVKDYLATVDIK